MSRRGGERRAALNPLESEITVGRDRDNGLGVVGNSVVIIVRELENERARFADESVSRRSWRILENLSAAPRNGALIYHSGRAGVIN